MIKGIALCELGKIMKGIPFIEKSLAMNPGLAVAREALAHFRRIMSGNVFG
jgi:hypothetical protein